MEADSSPAPSATTPASLTGAALFGVATGLRSSAGIAAAALSAPRAALPGPFGSAKARPITATLVVGELIGDVLPNTPNRTEPTGLIPRIAFGGLAAGVTASGQRRSPVVPALIGAAAAAGASFAGLALRRALTRRMPALAAAVLEDVLTGVVAAGALRLAARPTG